MQRRELRVPRQHGIEVADEARRIGDVFRFAVAMQQPREDAEHLEVALHADPVDVAPECASVADGQPGCGGTGVVPVDPGIESCAWPADERVLEQAQHVVRDRSLHGVLEVQDGRAAVGGHQVARHVVAMHQHARLRQGRIHQSCVGAFQRVAFVVVERQAQVPAEEPFVEQAQLAQQQRAVVGRQPLGTRDRLQAQQLGHGVVEQRVGVVGVEDLQVGRGAEVLEQQETGLDIAREHARHPHPAAVEQGVDAQPGTDVLQARRRIHHDAAGRSRRGRAPVAAEPGVDRCPRQFQRVVAGHFARPGLALAGARVVVFGGGAHAVSGPAGAPDAQGKLRARDRAWRRIET